MRGVEDKVDFRCVSSNERVAGEIKKFSARIDLIKLVEDGHVPSSILMRIIGFPFGFKRTQKLPAKGKLINTDDPY